MSERINPELLDAYLAGEATPEDSARIRQRLGLHQEQKDALELLLDKIPAVPGVKAGAPDPRLALQQFKGRQHFDTRAIKQGETYSGKYLRRWIGYGAVAIIAAVTLLNANKLIPPPTSSAQQFREVTTRYGERANISLPDGSTALLAPGSKIRYSVQFSNSRVVELQGQALFTVTSSKGVPFLIETAHSRTRVLGTSFSVRSYISENETRVMVAQGKVEVTNPVTGSAKVIGTAEGAVVDVTGNVVTSRIPDVAAAFAWTDGKLVFERTPLSQVAAELERTYNVHIQIQSDSLSNQLVTGTVANMSAHEAAAMLAATLSVRTQQQGRTILFMER